MQTGLGQSVLETDMRFSQLQRTNLMGVREKIGSIYERPFNKSREVRTWSSGQQENNTLSWTKESNEESGIKQKYTVSSKNTWVWKKIGMDVGTPVRKPVWESQMKLLFSLLLTSWLFRQIPCPPPPTHI